MDEPKRRYHIKLTGSAGSMRSLSSMLLAFSRKVAAMKDLDDKGAREFVVSRNAIGELLIESNPDATESSYHAELDAWVSGHELHPD